MHDTVFTRQSKVSLHYHNMDGFTLNVLICYYVILILLLGQPEPEFRPPMSEVVQALVRLVQRTNMSKRTTFVTDQGVSNRGGDNQESQDM